MHAHQVWNSRTMVYCNPYQFNSLLHIWIVLMSRGQRLVFLYYKAL